MEGVIKGAAEIADTEERLSEDLDVLLNVFVGPLRAWAAQLADADPTLRDLVAKLFSPLDEIVLFSGEFAAELRQAERSGRWAECFERHETALARCYGAYALQSFAARIFHRRVAATPWPRRGNSVETSRGTAAGRDADIPWRRVAAPPRGATWIFRGDKSARHRYAAAWAALASLRQRSEAVEAFVRCCELQPANARRLTLASLAIMPVQRPPRYVLLLGELQKRLKSAGAPSVTPGGDDDAALARALACAKRAAVAVDESIAAEDGRRAAVSRVAAKYQRCEATEAWAGARVLFDGAATRVTRNGPVDSYFALFEDRLVYGDEARALDVLTSRIGRRGSLGASVDAASSPTQEREGAKYPRPSGHGVYWSP